MPRTRRLDATEARIVGALMEKERTTPDAYPLTVKALVTACNQRSNRDPVVDFSEAEVRDGLERLRQDVLVWRSSGARVERWEHRLGSRWELDDAQQAVITLLLLRGAQTPGELRSRSERLHAFEDVAGVERTLTSLIQCDQPLVVQLERAPGQREARFRHTMLEGEETFETGPPVRDVSAAATASTTDPDLAARVRLLEERVARLESELGLETSTSEPAQIDSED